MKKIITSTFLAAVMALSLVACGNTVSDILDGNNDGTTTTTSETTTSEATTSDETTTSDDMSSSEMNASSSDMDDASSDTTSNDNGIGSSEADEVESALSTVEDFVNDQLDDANSDA